MPASGGEAGQGWASLLVSLGMGHEVPVTSVQPVGNFSVFRSSVCNDIKAAFPLSSKGCLPSFLGE